MRTNVVLNEPLMAEAMRIAGTRTKRETIETVLRDYVSRHRQAEWLDLAGSELIDPDYDVRAVRASD